MYASANGHEESMRTLIEKGASLEAVDKVRIPSKSTYERGDYMYVYIYIYYTITHTHTHTHTQLYNHTHTHTHTPVYIDSYT